MNHHRSEWEIPAMTLNEYESLRGILEWLINVCEEDKAYLEANESFDDNDVKAISDWYNNEMGREYF